MATYTDFLRQHDAEKPRIRRLYWIFGEEVTFRNLAVERVAELWGAADFNTTRISAADTPETEIWASLNQHPIDSDQRRLIVVTEAQKLKHMDRLVAWLKDNQTVRSAMSTAIFVSSDLEWEEDEHREALMKSSSASWVRCTLPKDEDDRLKRAQEVITSWGNVSTISAGILAQRVNFDMVEVRAVLDKVALFDNAQVTPELIEILAPRRVSEEIIWSILALNRRKAIEAIVEGGSAGLSQSIPAILGTLITHLDMLGQIQPLLATTEGAKQIAGMIGAKEQYVRKLYPYARMYPRREVLRRTQVLHRLDVAVQTGSREGVLESLVSLW